MGASTGEPTGTSLEEARGLSTSQAQGLLRRVGPNSVPSDVRRALWRRVGSALVDPLVLVLLGALVLTLVTGDFQDAAVIGLVLAVNTWVAVRQEIGADRALRALSTLASPTCRVVRDGAEQTVPVADVVPGDRLVLAEGDLVAADGVLLEAIALRMDESSLTGESVPVDKSVATEEITDAQRVLAGTAVVHGRGAATVVATGLQSSLGQIAALLQGSAPATPLQRRMRRLSVVLAGTVLTLCVVVVSIGLWQGQDVELVLLAGVSLAVAAVPESLPAVVTVTLSLAARRMARRHAVVRNLAAVETLGSVTLLATDKTGTLTEARMSVVRWWTAPRVEASALRRAVALCNDARLHADEASGHVGDPTEVALLVAARADSRQHPIDPRTFPRIAELPFDSERQRMTTVHRTPEGDVLVASKGAPEALLRVEVLLDPVPEIERARRTAAEMSASGLRVLAVAEARLGDGERDAMSGRLHLLGLVALQDPPKASAATTLAQCRSAGVRVVLVTGDAGATAASIARQVGLGTEPLRVLDLSRQVLDESLGPDVDVIARAKPVDKVTAVRGWQRQGHVVAMTGDGVNDGPALRSADIGVAMGGRGTEVARQSADLVLTDDELSTVVAAVEEGRRVYANIRRFLLYGLSAGMAEVLVMLAGPAVGVPLPLLPGQLLWINLLTHSLTGTALGSEPVEQGTMGRPPRSPDEGVLGGGLWWRTALLSVLVALCGGATAWVTPGPARQSALMLGMATAMLGVALGARVVRGWGTRGRPRVANPALPAAVAAAAVLVVAAVELPALQDLLRTASPGWLCYAAALAGAGITREVTRLLKVT